MKKKIKRIFGFVFALLILAVSVLVYCPRASASMTPKDDDYYYYVAYLDYVREDHQNVMNYIAYYNHNNGRWVWGYDGIIILWSEEEEYTYNVLVIVKCTRNGYNALDIVEYTTDLSSLNTDETTLYNNAYSSGVQVGNETAYDVGFLDGQNDVYGSLVPGNSFYDDIFQEGYDYYQSHLTPGNNEYDHIYNEGYAGALDDIGEDDPTFLVMFKSVINYFVEFFTVGLNVELFGVNIGGFCIAIFMLSIMMFIVRFIFGR